MTMEAKSKELEAFICWSVDFWVDFHNWSSNNWPDHCRL